MNTLTNPDVANTTERALSVLAVSSSLSATPTPPPGWSFERLQRIPYERRNLESSIYFGVTMPGGHWVDRDVITTAWRLFWRGVHALDRGRAHTAEGLCSDPGWADRGRGERLKLGRCFKYFAVHHVLPITLANPGKKGKRKYRIGEDVLSPSTVH